MDVFPNFTAPNVADKACVNTVFGGDFSLRPRVSPNSYDLSVSQFSAAMAHTVSVSFFSESVFDVGALIAKEEVCEFVAGAVVTLVQNVDAFEQRPVGVLPCVPMDVGSFSATADLAVTSFGFRSSPYFAGLHTSSYAEVVN